MIVDCIADLHGFYPQLKGGDLLIIAGDLTKHDTILEHGIFNGWVLNQNYKKKIFIAGNHDNCLFGSSPNKFIKDSSVEYLCDSGAEVSYHIDEFPEEDEGFLPSGKRTLKIWGSPWTKSFEGMNQKCKAFTVDTEEELDKKWDLIPKDVDILVTHSPPFAILDEVYNQHPHTSYSVGSKGLLKRVLYIRPKIHVFGHIHEAYGELNFRNKKICAKDAKNIQFINASHVNEFYKPTNKPIRVIL